RALRVAGGATLLVCCAGGGRRCFRRTRYSELLSGSVLHISLFYIQSFLSDDFGWLFGVFLMCAGAAGGFRNGLSILRSGNSSGGNEPCCQDGRQGKAK